MAPPKHLPPPNDELRERFGMNLRKCREQLGISQKELGLRSWIHPRSVSPFELGQKLPLISTFIRFAGSLAT